MKWHELVRLSEGALLEHVASGRRAILCEKISENRTMNIQFIDAHGSPVERAEPGDFRVALPPKDTVARGTL